MNSGEQGFLLLTSHLGDPQRKVLTVAQLRTLAARVRAVEKPARSGELTAEDLVTIGYSREEGQRIANLLLDTEQLAWYLHKGARKDCYPMSRVSDRYPQRLRQRLGVDCPGCLWTKGDLELLERPAVALVGSRELAPENLAFAREAGRQAALQGYVLISGNARGADRAAQDACLDAGGCVISVVADRLESCPLQNRVLYLSEDSFDAAFSTQRALSRNRVIHCLADITLVAQCALGKGGTWDGTVRNLRNVWSPVFCFEDGTLAARELEQRGAQLIKTEKLARLAALKNEILENFDQ